MTHILLEGARVANPILESISGKIAQRVSLGQRPPHLALILVGSDPASRIYVGAKAKRCEAVGMKSTVHQLPAHTSQGELCELITSLNHDCDVDGILVQLPLPEHVDQLTVIEHIDPSKDVDGFHPINMGRLLIGAENGIYPCTPLGIKEMLDYYGLILCGMHAVILGRSNIVGKPMAAMVMQRHPTCNATVTIAHRQTRNLKELCKSADLLISAIGQPGLVGADMIKKGAIVVDVGITRIEDATKPKGYYLTGDVDFDAVSPLCTAITPVPGGVGPMTVATLIKNCYACYQQRHPL